MVYIYGIYIYHIYIHIYTYIYIYPYINIFIYTYIFTYMVYIYVFIYTLYVYIYLHTCKWFVSLSRKHVPKLTVFQDTCPVAKFPGVLSPDPEKNRIWRRVKALIDPEDLNDYIWQYMD
jgi:hypothetical protein